MILSGPVTGTAAVSPRRAGALTLAAVLLAGVALPLPAYAGEEPAGVLKQLRRSADEPADLAVDEALSDGDAGPGLPDRTANVDGILDDIMRNEDGRAPRDGELDDPMPAIAAEQAEQDGSEERSAESVIEEAERMRPTRASEDDLDYQRPYDPQGVRVGSFRLYPSVTADETYDTNLFRVGNGASSDWYMTLRPSMTLRSDWNRHALEAEAAMAQKMHHTYTDEDGTSYAAALRGRLDISSASLVEADVSVDIEPQGRGGFETASRVAKRGETATYAAGVSYQHTFNRLTGKASLRSGLTEDSVALALDVDASDCDAPVPPAKCLAVRQTYADHSLGLRLGYEVSGALTLFAEGAVNVRDYSADGAGATNRDSNGFAIKIGADTDHGPQLRSSFAVGYAQQAAADTQLAGLHGTVVESETVWSPSALTTVTLSAGAGITSTGIEGSIGALETRGGVTFRHEFRRWLAGLASFDYAARRYAGVPVSEIEMNSTLGLEYAIDRRWALLAEYGHTDFFSSVDNREYTVNSVRLGVRAQR